MKNRIHMLDTKTGTMINSFIIEAEDGKLFVIDGGNKKDDYDLVDYLKRITGSEKPHIDAWFLSHAHDDHIDAFNMLMANHPDDVCFDALYYNFPSVQFLSPEEKDISIDNFNAVLPSFADKAHIVSLGDFFDFGALHVDVLYSPNPELTMNVGNNSSVIYRMTLGGHTLLFLGDCGIEEGEHMLEYYRTRGKADMLKAEYCQMAHHGQNGCTRELYEVISPRVCLWCTPKWLWDNDIGQGFNTHIFKTVEVRGWMEELGITEHYIAKDGIQVITLE